MKLTDYVVDFIAKEGIRHTFGITGGAVVHFFDSIDKHPDLTPIFVHHEQTASFAAEAYSRVTNNLGACFVTTGPGGTNAITGLTAAWLDSVPCLYFSGQQRFEHQNHNKPIRQLGSQQIDIVSIVTPLTKYAVLLEDSNQIKYELQKATYIARSGRPGPVWIDIPLNYQWADIKPDELESFDPSELKEDKLTYDEITKSVNEVVLMISASKRPLIIGGYGVRLSKAVDEFRTIIEKMKIPFVHTWNTCDLISWDNDYNMGCLGVAGQRGANLAVQNCDLLIALGSHLSMALTGTNFDAFAREAKRIVIDIDKVELDNPTVRVDLNVQCDVKDFINTLFKNYDKVKLNNISDWLDRCSKYKSYNIYPPQTTEQEKYVNPYRFMEILSQESGPGDVYVIDGGGTVLFSSFLALRVRDNQRLIVSGGVGAMGTGLPEAIGACFASNRKRTICNIGDGSMQFNIQELQTIVHHKLPIKIFIYNNDGYLSIRQTQDGFLNSNYVGTEAKGGLSIPDYQKVCTAYGIKTIRVEDHKDLRKKIQFVLNYPGPIVCELMVSRTQELMPRLGFKENDDGTFSGRPLEDMYPYLDRKEFFENMVIKPWTESE